MNTILFDMDGVLVNSEPVIIKAALAALAAEGIVETREAFLAYIGAGEEHFILGPAAAHGKSDRTDAMLKAMYALYAQNVHRELTVYSGAAETVLALHQRGYTLGLVSSSSREKLLLSLDAAKIPAKAFDLILSGSDVTQKKPNPEPYQKAAARLGKDPQECLVVEDALHGITAAKAAGMTCAAVSTSFPEAKLQEAGADILLPDLAALLEFFPQRR